MPDSPNSKQCDALLAFNGAMKTRHFDIGTLLAHQTITVASKHSLLGHVFMPGYIWCCMPSCNLCSILDADNIEALHDWCKRRFDGMGEQLEGFFKEVRSCSSCVCTKELVCSLLLYDVHIIFMSHI